jgi:hypothetical protein
MGFKCPVCFKDFGRDKEEWSIHTKTAHKGIGDDIRKALDIAVTPEASHNSGSSGSETKVSSPKSAKADF